MAGEFLQENRDRSVGFNAVFDYNNFRLQPTFDKKASAAFIRKDEKLEHALQNSKAKGLPPINVRPSAGQHLAVLTRLIGAKSVLEIGTLGTLPPS